MLRYQELCQAVLRNETRGPLCPYPDLADFFRGCEADEDDLIDFVVATACLLNPEEFSLFPLVADNLFSEPGSGTPWSLFDFVADLTSSYALLGYM